MDTSLPLDYLIPEGCQVYLASFKHPLWKERECQPASEPGFRQRGFVPTKKRPWDGVKKIEEDHARGGKSSWWVLHTTAEHAQACRQEKDFLPIAHKPSMHKHRSVSKADSELTSHGNARRPWNCPGKLLKSQGNMTCEKGLGRHEIV